MISIKGDARPQGIGMGHPFGLVLCCRLARVAEQEKLFAAAFRYGRRFELLWGRYPLPSTDVELVRLVFGSPDYLLSFAHFTSTRPGLIATLDQQERKGAVEAWLKQSMSLILFIYLFFFFYFYFLILSFTFSNWFFALPNKQFLCLIIAAMCICRHICSPAIFWLGVNAIISPSR